MSKTLVLAEKPSVGRDLAAALNCNIRSDGYMEGQKHIVTWALGHLITLAEPEDYNKKYKTWKMEDLPMLPPEFKLVEIKETRRQFAIVKGQMQRKDVGDIVIATDAGREGELVARWIIKEAKVRKPIKRLWISSVTDKAIKEGFRKLKEGKAYENLYASAEARAEADWLVGINATRALTCKFNAQLSCGRVQTPTLAIVAKREEEIQSFSPREYYGIEALAEGLKLTWRDEKANSFSTFDAGKVERIIESLKGKKAEVLRVDKAYKKKMSPGLYDLTELQRDANKALGFSAKETLSVMQRLYEGHKILTYPRTDSRYISSDIVDTLMDRIKACGVGPYRTMAFRIMKSPLKAHKGFVDDSKVRDHHAIIPTEKPVSLSDLSESERKIYDLVVKRFLSVLYPPYEYEETTIRAKIAEESFIARGKIVLAKGWKEVYDSNFEDDRDDDDLSEQILPEIKKGESLRITKVGRTSGRTKPPALHTEATLLSAMENPVKYMPSDRPDLIKVLGKTGGLGTVATRADIIEKLFSGFLIENKGKGISVTSKGLQLLQLVPEGLKSPLLTARWEEKLSEIAEGKLNKAHFVDEMRDYARAAVQEIRASEESFRHDNITRSKCPNCGKYMLEVTGKRGKMLVCRDRECGYRMQLSKTTNARCPDCHKRMELVGEGEGQTFLCACGFREKLSAFNERKNISGGKYSKRDVTQFLQKQKKDDTPINTGLADALSKLKLH